MLDDNTGEIYAMRKGIYQPASYYDGPGQVPPMYEIKRDPAQASNLDWLAKESPSKDSYQ